MALNIVCSFDEQHQLLTNKGFMFLEDVLACRDRNLQFASYDPLTRSMHYEHAQRLIVHQVHDEIMVEFTHENESFRWADGADLYGRSKRDIEQMNHEQRLYEQLNYAEECDADIDETRFGCDRMKRNIAVEQIHEDHDEDGTRVDVEVADCDVDELDPESIGRNLESLTSNRYSINVTRDHNMYALTGNVKGQNRYGYQLCFPTHHRFEKKKAEDLVEVGDDRCFKFMAHAEGGLCVTEVSNAASLMMKTFRALRLNTNKKQVAFLQFYGFWLNDGYLSFLNGCPCAVAFRGDKLKDFNFLKECLKNCEVDDCYYRVYKTQNSGSCEASHYTFAVIEPRWTRFFFGEYWSKYETAEETSICSFFGFNQPGLHLHATQNLEFKDDSSQMNGAPVEQEDESKQIGRSLDIISSIERIPVISSDGDDVEEGGKRESLFDEDPAHEVLDAADCTLSNAAGFTYSQEQARAADLVDQSELAYWRSRALGLRAPRAVRLLADQERDELLRTALSRTKEKRKKLFAVVTQRYYGEQREEIWNFLDTVLQTANLPFVRSGNAPRDTPHRRVVEECIISAKKSLFLPEVDQLLKELLGPKKFETVSIKLTSSSAPDWLIARDIVSKKLRSNGHNPPFHVQAGVVVALCYRNLQIKQYPFTGVTYTRLKYTFGPSFVFPKKDFAFDNVLARRNMLPVQHNAAQIMSQPFISTCTEAKKQEACQNSYSAKRLIWWALGLERKFARAIIHGFSTADRTIAAMENTCLTTSIRLRDQLLVLMLHAGYSATFRLFKAENAPLCTISKKTATAQHKVWALHYTSQDTDGSSCSHREKTKADPLVVVAKDVRTKSYRGRTWCVQMPRGFVIVRRARRNPSDGTVTCASLPTIQGNCLDEFNRIDIEVLSVIAQQLLVLREGRIANKSNINFMGVDIKLQDHHVIITMNPGYAGRTELPDNLQVCFRPVAMMVPNYALIAEIMLFAEGFGDAKTLSRKMCKLYILCSEQLSQQSQ